MTKNSELQCLSLIRMFRPTDRTDQEEVERLRKQAVAGAAATVFSSCSETRV